MSADQENIRRASLEHQESISGKSERRSSEHEVNVRRRSGEPEKPAYRVGGRCLLGWCFHLDVVALSSLSVFKLVVILQLVQQVGVHPQRGLREFPRCRHLLLGGLGVLQRILAGGVVDQLLLRCQTKRRTKNQSAAADVSN